VLDILAYARAVVAGDAIYVSGCTSLSAAGEPQAAGDWAAQSDLANEVIRWTLEQAGARSIRPSPTGTNPNGLISTLSRRPDTLRSSSLTLALGQA
jgi:enamine deaminase RidA (YjgF/YER057c/UK114 family)